MNKDSVEGQGEMQSSMQRDLAEEIYQLRSYLKTVNSPARRVVLGVLGGIGGVIGASIVAAPVLIFASKLIVTLGLGEN